MPSKGQRAAARQAKLRNNKKKRDKTGSHKFDPGPIESKQETSESVSQQEASQMVSQDPTPVPVTGHDSGRLSKTSETTPLYSHLGSELSRIGILTAVIGVILFILTFVMNG